MAFDVSLIRGALINRSPSAEAAEHLPPIQLSDPRPAGSRPTLCCEKSLLTPSIKGTLILRPKRPTAWTTAPGLITSGRARRRWPQRAQQPYQLSHSVTYHTFILRQGPQAPQACPLWLIHSTYAGGARGRVGCGSEVADDGNNCTSNLAPCWSHVCNLILRTMQGEHNGRVIRGLLFFKLISLQS